MMRDKKLLSFIRSRLKSGSRSHGLKAGGGFLFLMRCEDGNEKKNYIKT